MPQIIEKAISRLWPWRTLLTVMALCLLVLVATHALHVLLGIAVMLIVLVAAMLADVPARGAGATAEDKSTPVQTDVLGPVRALVAGLPDPCLLLSADGKVLFQNEHAREVLGRTKEGRSISTFLRAPEVIQSVRMAAQSGKPVRFEYFERVPTDRWFEAHIAPWRHHAGADAPDGLVLVLHDLTKQQRIERMRVDFVANASHELRTPLASLAGFIETLQGPAKDDVAARDRFLEIMRGQAWRMSRLIDDLLSLSRIESNAHVRPDALIDFIGVVQHVIDSLRPLAMDVGVEIVTQLPGEPLYVRGARDELFQVVQNLAENAIKYGETGKRVEISTKLVAGSTGAEKIVLSVRDFGPGIAPEHLPRLTERFYRIDVASSREKGGTGLGLAIVKHIVNRHRGTLNVESTLGKGANFCVTLERERPPQDPA